MKMTALLACIFLLMGCQTTSTGVGNAYSDNLDQVSSDEQGLEVLDLSYEEAVELALEAGKSAYKQVTQSTNFEGKKHSQTHSSDRAIKIHISRRTYLISWLSVGRVIG